MRKAFPVALAVAICAVGACSSPTPEERAARAKESSFKAQESIARERLKLVDQYRDCVIAADEDLMKIEACDTYLKAAEALK